MALQTPRQEIANTLTHGFGLALSLIGVVVLAPIAWRTGSPWLMAGVAVYSLSLLATYLSSTAYHGVRHGALKNLLQKVDHIAIYFLIGGSYTPFVLLYLDPGRGQPFLALLWGFILVGIVYKIFWMGRLPIISVAYYLLLGWMAVFLLRPMLGDLPPFVLWAIAVGGVFYSAGVTFYLWKGFTYHHAVWHLFVVGGSACHYAAILYAVAGLGAPA